MGVQNTDRVPNYNNQTIAQSSTLLVSCLFKICVIGSCLKLRQRTMSLTSKENSTLSLSFWYNSTFFLLSWQLLQLERARFQGRVWPDQREDLKLVEAGTTTFDKFSWPSERDLHSEDLWFSTVTLVPTCFRNFNLPRCWSGERLSCAQIYRSCCICPKEEVRSEICRWLPGSSPNWMRNTTEYPDRQTSTRACYQRNLRQEPWCSSRRTFLLQSWHNLHHGWVHRGWQLCPVLGWIIIAENRDYEHQSTGSGKKLICSWINTFDNTSKNAC